MAQSINILQKVETFIKTKHLFNLGEILLVGVSGGVDSVVLLHILVKLGYKCVVAHMNFHLRGVDSDGDEDFVKQIALKHKCIFEVKSVDTLQFAQEHGISIEMAARELRYGWFEELKKKHHISNVVVGHHKNDAIETFFLNLLRSSGLRGLGGISPKQNNVARPLLAINRDDILMYASDWRLEYRTDISNDDIIYKRNNIRHNVIPLLQSIEPSFDKVMDRNLGYLQDAASMMDDFMERWRSENLKLIDGHLEIAYDAVISKSYGRLLLFEVLKEYGFKNDVISDIYNVASQESGREFFSNRYRLVSDRDKWILIEGKHKFDSVVINKESIPYRCVINNIAISFQLLNRSDVLNLNEGRDIAYFDYDRIVFPLALDRWHKGEWFIPLGMKGRKLISDYMIDNKFTLIQKQNLVVLNSGDKIMWLIGERIDERFKITSETSRVLKVIIA